MRISDWSSDVCSSDLRLAEHALAQSLDVALVHGMHLLADIEALGRQPHVDGAAVLRRALLHEIAVLDHLLDVVGDVRAEILDARGELAHGEQIGRAACRERVGQYGYNSGVSIA